MNFEDRPFEEKVKLWFGSDPVAAITETLAKYHDGTSGLHLNGPNGVHNEPGEPSVGVALGSGQGDTFSWVRFHMVYEGAAYVEEMHVNGWNYTRITEEAQAWRRAVQRGDKDAQRIGTAAT